jgi:hypothetical protein
MMNQPSCLAACVILTVLLGSDSAVSIEIKGAPRPPAQSANSASSYAAESGIVTRIDAKSGSIELDGSRRFSFDPATVLVRQQSNRSRSSNLTEVNVGARVSVTIVRKSNSSSATVSEVWIAR